MALLTIRKGGRTNYPYAVARIQARRAKLIPVREYDKILKMDVSEITRFIEESAYKAEVDELSPRFTGLDLLEAALVVNQERAFSAVRRMLGGEGGALVDLFLQRFFVDDLKTLLRGKNAGAGREELLKEMLIEDLDTYNVLLSLLADDVRTPEDVGKALDRHPGIGHEWAKVLLRVPPEGGLSAYEDALDKAYFARLVESLEGSKQKGAAEFLEFTRREIDTRNLLNAARWVASGQKGEFSGYVIPGGKHLKVPDVVALSRADDLGQFGEALAETPLHEAVREGLEEARRTDRLVPFQRAADRHLMADLGRLGHMHPLSILPVLLYLIQKHREVVTLRAVARGKAAGLSEARLRELVQ